MAAVSSHVVGVRWAQSFCERASLCNDVIFFLVVSHLDFLSCDVHVVKLLLFGDLSGLSCPKLLSPLFLFLLINPLPPPPPHPRFFVRGAHNLGRRNGEV